MPKPIPSQQHEMKLLHFLAGSRHSEDMWLFRKILNSPNFILGQKEWMAVPPGSQIQTISQNRQFGLTK